MKNLADIKGRTIFVLFLITMTVYVVMLTITIPKLMMFSEGKEILDMMPGGYDTAYVRELMTALSEEGRSYYLTKQLPLDFFYPALFAVTYSLIFMFFLRKIGKHQTARRVFAFLPVIAGLADYIENICIIALLKAFPNISADLVLSSSIASVVKASSTTIYFFALTILIIALGISTIRHRVQTRHAK